VSSLNPDQFDRWQQGECGTYAVALQKLKPGLKFGTLADADNVETHHFAYDDTHAYDSNGRTPLAELSKRAPQVWLNEDPNDYGLPHSVSDARGVDDAIEHARKNRVLK
jgi:hypothetical protein